MRKEIVQTGKTADEAVNDACMILGCTLTECEWEIINLPKKSFFGLKKIPAKVRVWIEVPDEVKKEKQLAIPSERAQRKETEPKVAEGQGKPKARPAPPRVPAPVKQPAKITTTMQSPDEDQRGQTPEDIARVEAAKEYILGIMTAMGISGEMEVRWEDSSAVIAVNGKGMGALIGRRGDTLDAVQYLAGLCANRLDGEYLRIIVDFGDYRLKRNRTIVEAAKKAAEEVLRTNISKTLEVMNPAERRVVHSTLSEIAGVSSTSVGKDPYRRVMVKSPTSKTRSDSRDSRSTRSDSRSTRSTGGRRDQRRDENGGRTPYRKTEETPVADRPAPYTRVEETTAADRPAPYTRVEETTAADRPAPYTRVEETTAADRPAPYTRVEEASTADRPAESIPVISKEEANETPLYGKIEL